MKYILDIIEHIWMNIGTQLFFIGAPWKEGILTTLNILPSELLIITIYCMIFYHIRNLDKINLKALLISCLIISLVHAFLLNLQYVLIEPLVFKHNLFLPSFLADVIIAFPFIFFASWLADLIARRFSWPLKLVIFSLALIIISVIIWAAWVLVLFSLSEPPVD